MKRYAYLILISWLFLNLAGQGSGFAKTYTGFIEKSNNAVFVTRNGLRFEMQFAEARTGKVLEKLNNKDFISVDATALTAEENAKSASQIIRVSSVNYVGLKELTGFWKDKTGLCYYFVGFTTIKVFIPGPKLKCQARSIPEINQRTLTSYNYFINPDGDVWTMLISNEQSQYLAELTNINSTTKKLVMYNAEDGKELPSVILYKSVH
ncbi:MAG: hypothetical protein H7Z71_08060 [Moraxellaceae bacterium]|nr:hypothetical protein [Pseudobdellovibrionaceae bacterium]